MNTITTTTTRGDLFQKCHEFTEATEARSQGLYPYFRPIEGFCGARIISEGRELIMAGSNNYLGLSLDPRVREAAIDAIKVYGASCSGSRFMNGTLKLHEELEQRLAAFVGKPAALCFTTGYQTNLGAISALVGRGEHIITDKLNHASIMDGIFMALGMTRQIQVHRYKHNNIEQLEQILESLPADEPKLLVTDGVFSMEGDIAKLPQIRELADRYGVRVYLDEAHAIGVTGATGRGTVEHHGGAAMADLVMCTFSKSFGSIGGFVAGDEAVVDFIKHFARPLIFSASMPPSNLAAVMKSLEIIENEPERVSRLQQIAARMRRGFTELGFDIGTSETAVIPLIIGDNQKTFLFWKYLYENGVYVNPVVSPAVPPNRALIRTSYMAIHEDSDLDRVLEVSAAGGKAAGIL
ncbi:MAG: pyridoxal phosphate-dependent aminotransferase family protein [Spirochaetaceae bacterium]|nr:MAG: pyridoxal phosphate-dependent aminotransferase family protein [Spirochaetaceae bacterium]